MTERYDLKSICYLLQIYYLFIQIRGGTLQDVVTYRHVGTHEKVRRMALGTARGLEYIHLHDRIHRDIAARNVLYTREKIVS